MENIKKSIAETLLEIQAVTLSLNPSYIWASGIKSPIYCDNRLLLSHIEARKKIVGAFLNLIKQERIAPHTIAGVATSGIPWAAWISEALDLPMVYIRKKTKDHGKENLIEGKLEKGKQVLVVEDLISTGGSSLAAAKAVNEAGGISLGVFAIFTYEMKKAEKSFNEANIPLKTLTNFSALIEVAEEANYLKKEDKKHVLEFASDPIMWAKKRK